MGKRYLYKKDKSKVGYILLNTLVGIIFACFLLWVTIVIITSFADYDITNTKANKEKENTNTIELNIERKEIDKSIEDSNTNNFVNYELYTEEQKNKGSEVEINMKEISEDGVDLLSKNNITFILNNSTLKAPIKVSDFTNYTIDKSVLELELNPSETLNCVEFKNNGRFRGICRIENNSSEKRKGKDCIITEYSIFSGGEVWDIGIKEMGIHTWTGEKEVEKKLGKAAQSFSKIGEDGKKEGWESYFLGLEGNQLDIFYENGKVKGIEIKMREE